MPASLRTPVTTAWCPAEQRSPLHQHALLSLLLPPKGYRKSFLRTSLLPVPCAPPTAWISFDSQLCRGGATVIAVTLQMRKQAPDDLSTVLKSLPASGRPGGPAPEQAPLSFQHLLLLRLSLLLPCSSLSRTETCPTHCPGGPHNPKCL